MSELTNRCYGPRRRPKGPLIADELKSSRRRSPSFWTGADRDDVSVDRSGRDDYALGPCELGAVTGSPVSWTRLQNTTGGTSTA